LVIDLLRCMGCGACSIACKAERGTPAGISYNKVKMSEIGKYPNAKMKFLPMSCMHCKKPHCLEACPNEATYQRDDGLVLIDKEKCVGCGACVVACPYGSRQLLKEMENYYAGNYPTPYELLKRMKAAGNTTIYACSPTMQWFGIKKEDLIPEVDQIAGAATFLDIASDANISLMI